MTITIDTPAPNFSLLASNNETVTLHDLRGNNIILYFYPKDNTPGCTTQGLAFSDKFADFAKLDTVILGISRDSIKSHQNFKTKYDFAFELLADTDSRVCELYEVIKDKNMYGKTVRGIERSTFLIDKQGILRQVWRKVKVAGHIDEVLKFLQTMN